MISNTAFKDNLASGTFGRGHGGAIEIDGLTPFDTTVVTLNNVTCTGNTADQGGCLDVDDYVTLHVTKSTFLNNTITENGNGGTHVSMRPQSEFICSGGNNLFDSPDTAFLSNLTFVNISSCSADFETTE